MNWDLRYANEKTAGEYWNIIKDNVKGIGTDLRDMFSPNRDAFGNLKRDPSQCKKCGRDFYDAKTPKQRISDTDYWVSMQTGQQHLLPQKRSDKDENLCVNCDIK